MEQRITLITLGVSDVARARRFYVDGLGFRPAKDSNDEVVFIDCGGVVLALWSRAALAEDAALDSEGSGFRGFSLAHNVRDRASVDRVLDEVARAGATIVKPPKETFWGGYLGYFKDPDGFLWEVAHNPGWPLDDHGRPQL